MPCGDSNVECVAGGCVDVRDRNVECVAGGCV